MRHTNGGVGRRRAVAAVTAGIVAFTSFVPGGALAAPDPAAPADANAQVAWNLLYSENFANPAPRNNHFWHYRRKVLMDSFSQHPDGSAPAPAAGSATPTPTSTTTTATATSTR
ncbi:hypothetical protein ACIBF5_11965 [Micromonospora sp. NPDC050417]|uniref:hypothetical protein n=1 Tax=Micromonospora sp. NPDC050417 TaxID=3364280 RepID=UPI00379BD4D7